MMQLPKNVVVTGGSGFLGKAMVECLVEQGCNVTVFDITTAKFDSSQVTTVKGNLLNQEEVTAAFKGNGLVIHLASPNPSSDSQTLQKVNVDGTKNVIQACVNNGIEKLVFTSSASVVFGGDDQYGVDESIGYPSEFRDEYSRTKADAERAVLEAATQHKGKLATVSIRPHGIFGPKDAQLVPTLIEMARQNKSKFAIGNCDNVVDFTYVGNVVHGHMRAAEKLTPNSPVNGKAYFITNDEPIRFWEFMGKILTMFDYDAPSIRLPYKPMLAIAHVAQGVAKMLGKEITLSPSRLVISATHHWYRCEAAKRDLGYRPLWNLEQGLYLTKQFFRYLKNPRPRVRREDADTDADKGEGSNLSEEELPLYSEHEVARHNTKDDLWIIVDGYVYDVTKYVDRHPGGEEALLRKPGKDNSEGFHGPQHPDSVQSTIKRFIVGRIKTEADDPPVPEKSFTRDEVGKHNKEEDCWVIIDNKVYDMTTFVPKHPGGPQILIDRAGTDITTEFFGPQHGPEVKNMLYRFILGRVAE